MDYKTSKLPSFSSETEYFWKSSFDYYMDFKNIKINDSVVNFTLPVDYFELTDEMADNISFEGRKLEFFSQNISLSDFGMSIFGDISPNTQIGGLLSNVANIKPSTIAFSIDATFKYIEKSVYCAFSIGVADEDSGMELEVAVVEIGQDEHPYINPVSINEDVLYYYSLDDIAKISYWLGNLWIGIQFKLNNYPEEIRVIDESTFKNFEKSNDNSKRPNITFIKKVTVLNNNAKTNENAKVTKEYKLPSWGVRGHKRILPDGREIHVRPYRKGRERKNPSTLVKKEYKFEDCCGKLKLDTEGVEIGHGF